MSKPAVLPPDATLVTGFAAMLPAAPEPPKTKGSRNAMELLKDHARKQGHQEGLAAGFEEGVAAGREAGFAAALEEGRQQQAKLLERFADELITLEASIQQAVKDWFETTEGEVESLVASIARKVLHSELKLSRDSIRAIVDAALAEVTLSKSARIRVNPSDLPTLLAAKAELMAACASLRTLEIVEDPTIVGGCVIETDGGSVEASVDGQIDRLEAA